MSDYSSQIRGEGQDGKPYNIPIVATSHFSLKNQKTSSIIVTRSQGKFTPKNQGTFTSGDILRIEIPSTQWLDTEEFAISCEVAIVTAGTTTPVGYWKPDNYTANSLHFNRLKNGVQSLFDRVKIMQGTSIPLEDIQSYNILHLMLLYGSAPKTWVDNIGFHLEGVHSGWNFTQQCIMNNWNTNGGAGTGIGSTNLHEYYFRPYLGLFRTGKFLPMGYLGMLTFEFYFVTPPAGLLTSCRGQINVATNSTTDGVYWNGITNAPVADTGFNDAQQYALPNGNVSFIMQNVYAHCVWLNPREELNNALQEKLKAGTGINVYFDTFRNQTRQMNNQFSTGEQVVIINERVASLKGVIGGMINQYDDRSMSREIRFNPNGMQKYRWRIGDTFYPQTDVIVEKGGVEAYVELMRFFGQDTNVLADNLIKYLNYAPEARVLNNLQGKIVKNSPCRGVGHSDRFLVGFNCENSVGQISGIDTLRMNSDIELRYTLNTDLNGTGLYSRNFVAIQHEQWNQNSANRVAPVQNLYGATAFFAANPAFTTGASANGPYWNTVIDFSANLAVTWTGAEAITTLAGTADGARNNAFMAPFLTELIHPFNDESGPCGLVMMYGVTQGVFGAVGLHLAGNAANGNASDVTAFDAGFATTRIVSLYTPCLFPTYFTWQFFTHFDAVLQIKTFGTCATTTDIFQL